MDAEAIKAKAHIRWMIRRDMEEVIEIERAAFSHPWSERDFTKTLRERNCIGMVAERGELIVGYMVYELEKKSLRILNFAVDHRRQREGVGSAMVAKLKGKLRGDFHKKRGVIETHVREGNLAACLFFQAMGFKAVEICRDYYEDSTEDAYRFEHRAN